MGAGYLQTGYYAGFFLAAALNYTVGAHFGWRAMFLCGLAPVVVSLLILLRVKEPERWERSAKVAPIRRRSPLGEIFRDQYRRRTLVNTGLLTVAIIGLWAAAVYEPTAIITLARKAGNSLPAAVRLASFGTGLLSIGTILGCLALPPLAERFGRKRTLALYFAGMGLTILLTFGWAFYLPHGLHSFIALLFVLGFFGGNFTMFSLWLPEQYGTSVRATAFAFATSFGRFIGAGVNFILGALVHNMGTLGKPVAFTAIAFGIGLLLIPFGSGNSRKDFARLAPIFFRGSASSDSLDRMHEKRTEFRKMRSKRMGCRIVFTIVAIALFQPSNAPSQTATQASEPKALGTISSQFATSIGFSSRQCC